MLDGEVWMVFPPRIWTTKTLQGSSQSTSRQEGPKDCQSSWRSHCEGKVVRKEAPPRSQGCPEEGQGTPKPSRRKITSYQFEALKLPTKSYGCWCYRVAKPPTERALSLQGCRSRCCSSRPWPLCTPWRWAELS
jgi:hypothetical protein